ncbi:glycosyltransferase family 4 protein [Marinobacter sp.]|uniref:glycosyltransferase family 4 protein n=1 Tax=Marinobacter sp. TaxID=50741 RepID=UPI0034A19837
MTSAGSGGVWFPAVQVGTGVDKYTERLVLALNKRGVRAEITWLPKRAEYFPFSVSVPEAPSWASLVHVNSWLHSRFIPDNLPLVVTVHSCVHDPMLIPYKSCAQSWYHQLWVKRCEALSIRKATAVTAVSAYTATMTEHIFDTSGIKTIYNWVDTEAFPERKTVTKCKSKPFRVLCIGSLNKRKGSDLLPAIMRELGEGFELRVTGNLHDWGNISDIAHRVKNIGYLRSVADLVHEYHSNDVLLFPTRLEGFGLVAVEAMSCGLPVVASNCSSLPEVVGPDMPELLCEVDDVVGFARAIRNLRDSNGLYERSVKIGRKRVLNKFSEERAVNSYIELYQSLGYF